MYGTKIGNQKIYFSKYHPFLRFELSRLDWKKNKTKQNKKKKQKRLLSGYYRSSQTKDTWVCMFILNF